MSKLRIAICGTRGIPANYGGFETFAEELSWRLVKRGHEVTVYGRAHCIPYQEPTYRGVNIKLLPALRSKYLQTPVHTLFSLLDVIKSRQTDVILVCNAANSAFLWIPRLAKIRVAVNVDGIERLRAKWNRLGKLWYKLGEQFSVWWADAVISDAKVISDYYQEAYRCSSTVIPYGCNRNYDEFVDAKLNGEFTGLEKHPGYEHLVELGISRDNYILYVSRLEPENNAHVVIEAYERLRPDLKELPLVIVGDAPYADRYKAKLRALAKGRVIFAGGRYAEAYGALQLGARVFVQATEVGGTHPCLVESMGFGNCVIANGTPENREVLGDAGVFYEKNNIDDLCAQLTHLLETPDQIISYRKRACIRARTTYDWSVVTDAYERLFAMLTKAPTL